MNLMQQAAVAASQANSSGVIGSGMVGAAGGGGQQVYTDSNLFENVHQSLQRAYQLDSNSNPIFVFNIQPPIGGHMPQHLQNLHQQQVAAVGRNPLFGRENRQKM